MWEGFRPFKEICNEVPLPYVYSDTNIHDPQARIDSPEIYWFHNQPNGLPERMTEVEGNLRWEGQSSAWGKLLRETTLQGPDYSQNIRMQGQYLDRDKFVGNKFEQR